MLRENGFHKVLYDRVPTLNDWANVCEYGEPKVCSESGRKSLLGWMSGDAKGSQSSRQNTAQNSVASNDHIVRTARKRALPMFRYALFRLLKRISLHHVINDAAGNWRGFGSPARIIMRPLGRSACTKDTCNSLDGAVARITKAPPNSFSTFTGSQVDV